VLRLLPAILIALPAFAQLQADITALAARPSLAAWQKTHPGERLDRAHYDTSKDEYEVDYLRLNRWCAASVADTPQGMTRAALFYVPSPHAPLPYHEDPALVRACELDALWYETPNEALRDSVVRDLSAALGKPEVSDKPDIQGSALWENVLKWRRSGIGVWVAHTGRGLIVYAGREMPRDWDVYHWSTNVLEESPAQFADATARIAALDAGLTSRMLGSLHCGAGPLKSDAGAIETLARWLEAARALAPARRAAALLMADFFITCAGVADDSDPVRKRLAGLGAKYETRFDPAGPEYLHNFRGQAERLDPHGPAGELAGLISLADRCFLAGSRSWPDVVIEKGEGMLKAFPDSRWTPSVHFALAGAHATKLEFAYPGGDLAGYEFLGLSQTAMDRERSAAIAHFRYFVNRQPRAPESVFAWQEAWRLLAGLPPSRITFSGGD